MNTIKFLTYVRDFVIELVWAIKTIPSEAYWQWREAHIWDQPKGEYKIVPDANHHSLILVPNPDYVMWKRLGYVAHTLLALIAVAIVFLTIMAASYVA